MVEQRDPHQYLLLIVGVVCERAVVPRSPHWEVESRDPVVLCWRLVHGRGLCWSHDLEGVGHVCEAEGW